MLLVLGPKRLPELGKGLGRGMREFKDGITGDSKDEEAERSALTPPAAGTDSAVGSGVAGSEHAPDQPRTPDQEQVAGGEQGSSQVGSEHRS
ncbi:MAG: twin-arginine translocase TatA/TatE family subunit [Actinomycetota bacterium]|nr:twin-arginine translocase TatA/TatE family subunit [Actinomycetota bacterium]